MLCVSSLCVLYVTYVSCEYIAYVVICIECLVFVCCVSTMLWCIMSVIWTGGILCQVCYRWCGMCVHSYKSQDIV